MRRKILRVPREHLLRQRGAFRIVAGSEPGEGQRVYSLRADARIARTQPERVLRTLDGLFPRPLCGKRVTQSGVCQRRVRVQVQGPAVCSYSIAMAAHAKEHHALSDVRPRIALIEAEGRASVRARARTSRLQITYKGHATQGDNSQQAVCLPVVGR